MDKSKTLRPLLSIFFKKLLVMGVALSSVLPIISSANVYQNSIRENNWSINENNLECLLSQKIPRVLSIDFIQQSGLEPVSIVSLSRARESTKVSFYFSSPDWHINKISPVFIVDSIMKSGKVELKERETRKIWDVLSAGYALEINLPNGDIARINPVGFSSVYEDFNKCIINLLPYSFEQLEWSDFKYQGGGVSLTEDMKERIDYLVDYYNETNLIDQFVVDGHSDSAGKMLINRDLSKKRAQLIVEYLEDKGIPSEIIEMRFHGQNYPIASNNTSAGRDSNRRATIRVYKKSVSGRKLVKDMDIYDKFVATRQIVGGATPDIYENELAVHESIEADQILQAVSADTEFQMLEKGLDINGEDGVAESLWSGERRVKGGIPRIVKGIETFNGISPDDFTSEKGNLIDEMRERGLSQEVLVDERTKGENNVILQQGDGFTEKEIMDLNTKSREGISIGKFADIEDSIEPNEVISNEINDNREDYNEPDIKEIKDIINGFFMKSEDEK